MEVRPRVTLKIAQTLDGRIATRSGHSRWVTGPASRALAHRLRAEHDAILVGINTVLLDDPQLTVRLAQGRDPMRIVVDSSLRLPPAAAVLARDGIPVLVATLFPPDEARALPLRERGAEILALPGADGRVDLAALLHRLHERTVRSVLVEGGATIATDFIRRRLVDELVIFIAPKLLGAGIDAVGDLGAQTMADAVSLEVTAVEQLEDGDIVVRATPRWDDR